MTSVNTNVAAQTALRTLQSTNAQLDQTQNRISTGLKIAEAKDNAAYWSISTTLKSDSRSLATVQDALSLGAATVDTAYQGTNQVRTVLEDLQNKIILASGNSADKTALQAEISQLQQNLRAIANSAGFSGENWLSVDPSRPNFSNNKSIVSSFNREQSGAVTLDTIQINAADFVLINADADISGILDGGKADAISVGGLANQVTAALGTGTTTPATPGTLTTGAISLTDLRNGDVMNFQVKVDDGSFRAVSVTLADVSTLGAVASSIQSAIRDLGGGAATTGLTVAVTDTDKLLFTSGSTGATSDVQVQTFSYSRGATTPTPTTGFADVNGVDGRDTIPGGRGGFTTGAIDLSGLSNGNLIKFNVTIDGGSPQAAQVTWNTGDDLADIATKLQAEIRTKTGGTGFTVVVTDTNKLEFRSGTEAVSGTASNASVSSFTYEAGVSDSTTVTPSPATGFADVTGSAGANRQPATAGKATTGNLNLTGLANGDRLTFNIALDGGSSTAVTVTLTDVSSRATIASDIQAQIRTTLSSAAGISSFTVGASGQTFEFTSGTTGSASDVVLSGFSYSRPAGSIMPTTGFADANGVDGGPETSNATAAEHTFGAFPAEGITFDANATLSFQIAVGAGGARTVTIDRATVVAAGFANGTVATAANFATVMTRALQNSGVTGVTVTDDAGAVKLETTATGNTASVQVTGVGSSSGVNILTLDVSSANDAQLGRFRDAVVNALGRLTDNAATLGAIAKRIELQETFVSKLVDTIDKGVSGLIDADMNEESTRLQALQVKQQLGVQALSIANQSAQNVLSLFR